MALPSPVDQPIVSWKLSFFKLTREYRELVLLSEIARSSRVSQRQLASAAHISSAMVNSYLEDLCRRALVTAGGKNRRSYRYRLTPQGQRRRDLLLFQSSKEIIQLYGQMKRQFHNRLETHARSGVRTVVLFGAAETAEMVVMAAPDSGIRVVGIVDNDSSKQGKQIGNVRISAPGHLERLRPDAVLVTSFGHKNEIIRQIRHLEEKGIRVLDL